MSSTILTFTDFFWIWFIVAIASGGMTYLRKSESPSQQELHAVKEQLAALTEEIRALHRDATA
jgi:hypothetical protein